MRTLLIFVLLLCTGFSASARMDEKALGDATYLRRLSFHIRGERPTRAEYEQLARAIAEGKRDEFFSQKIDAYLASEEYIAKMDFRLDELFRLKTDWVLPGDRGYQRPVPLKDRNALNELFRTIVKENLPWDTLLKGKTYKLYPRTTGEFGLGDMAFMRSISPELPGPAGDVAPPTGPFTPVDMAYGEDDPRIAGALSTSRFFGRYTTTALNKNRRRAAAVFDIFLCDTMSAAVPPPPSDPDGILDRAFPETSDITDEDRSAIAQRGDKHGSDAACAQCHYKLDPMGQAFAASALALSPFPSGGRLVYRDKKTEVLVDVPGRGLGDVARAISEQRAYVDCQMGYFWKWYIGQDRKLTEERRRELAEAFERVGRRTNDFVKYMVTLPEFRSLDVRSETQVRADNVRAVLQNCTNCHSQRIPSFVEWPIGGDALQMKEWVGKIARALDLENNGAARTMPPSYSGWQPSLGDLETLKAWVADGAPDEEGRPQIGAGR